MLFSVNVLCQEVQRREHNDSTNNNLRNRFDCILQMCFSSSNSKKIYLILTVDDFGTILNPS